MSLFARENEIKNVLHHFPIDQKLEIRSFAMQKNYLNEHNAQFIKLGLAILYHLV